MNVDI